MSVLDGVFARPSARRVLPSVGEVKASMLAAGIVSIRSSRASVCPHVQFVHLSLGLDGTPAVAQVRVAVPAELPGADQRSGGVLDGDEHVGGAMPGGVVHVGEAHVAHQGQQFVHFTGKIGRPRIPLQSCGQLAGPVDFL